MSSVNRTRRLLAKDVGQATVEYALVTLLTVVILAALWNMFGAFRDSGIASLAAKHAPYGVSDVRGLVKDVLMQ